MESGRSYTSVQPNPDVKAKSVRFNCPECKKNYVKEAKLKAHIEKMHYLCTRDSNRYYLDLEDEIKIYTAASDYLHDILAGCTFPVLGGDQERFLARLKETRVLIGCDWRRVFRDFKAFINMGLPYYDTNFCPTLLIDFMWHAVMAKGHIVLKIPHCAKDRTPEEDHLRYLYFCQVFKHQTGREPYTGSDNQSADADLYNVVNQLRELPVKIVDEMKQQEREKAEAAQRRAEEEVKRVEEAKRRAIEEKQKYDQREREKWAELLKLSAEYKDLFDGFGWCEYLRYKVISHNHPAHSTREQMMMIKKDHSCKLCDPPVSDSMGSTC